jgi:hypothetical protein
MATTRVEETKLQPALETSCLTRSSPRRMVSALLLLLISSRILSINATSTDPQRLLSGIHKGYPLDDEDDFESDSWVFGQGRQFDLFRGGTTSAPRSNDEAFESMYKDQNTLPRAAATTSSTPTRTRKSRAGGRSSAYYHRSSKQQQQQQSVFEPVTNWWRSNISPNIRNWPKLQCRVEPTTTLKIRKTFRPLKTIVRLGADFNTQLGVWQFKSSWEDAIIGGKLTLIAGRELQLTKSWQLSVGAVEDLVTRLRFRAAVDLQTWKAYARVGFRTERLSPINVMEGFTLLKRVPLDGNKGHVKLEVKANLALPEPEIEYSTETQRSLIGMGDVEVSIEELNLVLDY